MPRFTLTALTVSAALAAAPAHASTGGVGAGSTSGAAPSGPAASTPGRPLVAGTRAKLVGGIAYAPSAAPARVQALIWAVNGIVRKPYVYGGGHQRFRDRGYDCSGLVSFALNAAGLLRTPLDATEFLRYGSAGRGRWITVWAKRSHVFAQVAGLRLDTTAYPSQGVEGPRWRPLMRDVSAFEARHPAGL